MKLITFEIISRKKAATDAVILQLREKQGNAVAYEAGQFLTFLLFINGRELRRSYSIASAPGTDEPITVVIKRQENGEVSRYIIDHYNIGDELVSLPPAGRFTINLQESENKNIFFIAAGSGISPVFSLIRKLLLHGKSSKLTLIYQNRNERSVIFKEEILQLQLQFSSRFHVIQLFSAPSDDQQPMRLNNNQLEQMLLNSAAFDPPSSLFYICGPRAFMRMAVFVLKLLHVPEKHIRQEEYVVDLFPPPPFMEDHSAKNLQITYEGKDYTLQVAYPQSILEAALQQHIQLPYSCRGGKCSSCIARCISGKVKMSINQVLTHRDLEEGWVLTCVGYAETDIQLEI